MLKSVMDQMFAWLHRCITIGGKHVKLSNLQSEVKFIGIILCDEIQLTKVIHG
jgi:hypothetical protein